MARRNPGAGRASGAGVRRLFALRGMLLRACWWTRNLVFRSGPSMDGFGGHGGLFRYRQNHSLLHDDTHAPSTTTSLCTRTRAARHRDPLRSLPPSLIDRCALRSARAHACARSRRLASRRASAVDASLLGPSALCRRPRRHTCSAPSRHSPLPHSTSLAYSTLTTRIAARVCA